MEDKQRQRVRFAEALMEEAEHSSEIAMRTSLSRAYYALHHLGIEITGSKDHGEVRNKLRGIDRDIGDQYGVFLEVRSKMDYTPSQKAFGLDGLDAFRGTFRNEMLKARVLFERLKELL